MEKGRKKSKDVGLCSIMGKIFIGVIGSSEVNEKIARIAFEVGKEIASRGGILVCGGLGGIMENAARGAKEGGGLTIGILPGDSPHEANPYIDIAIPTGMGEARNIIIIRTVRVVIAISGEYGTLSEIGFALRLGKPVIGLYSWELAKAGKKIPAVIPVRTAGEAVEKAISIARSF